MIRCGVSTPQEVTITGTGFVAGALVLVTPPGETTPIQVTPISVTSTVLIFRFVFVRCGAYTIVVTDETGDCDTCASAPFTLTPTPLPCVDICEDLTLGQLVTDIQHRLGDEAAAIWPVDEIEEYLNAGYFTIATQLAVFWDQFYAENLPRGFSVTQPWELLEVPTSGGFDYGVANFTAEFERRAGKALGWEERRRIGPANHTSPFEATDGLLARAGASTAISATVDLPTTLTKLDRASWDNRWIEPLEPRSYSKLDGRYETTAGEVYAYTFQKDGVRTLRKIRRPSVQSDTWTFNGTWGTARTVSDISADTTTGTWGLCRRVSGEHPMGPSLFGAPRRFFREGKNVRVEYFRHGNELGTNLNAICELPTRYALYLRDYVQQQCLSRPGPGYDQTLADHFLMRWTRGLTRIARRLDLVDTEHVTIMGGDGRPSTTRPPRPSLPYSYGSRVR